MNMVCYELVCYERDLLWTGLLWTWSVINESVMNGSVMNVVCFEWSVLSGLLWAGLFWTVTVPKTAPKPPNSSASVLKTSSHNIGFVGFLGNVEPKWCRKYRKWLCCEIWQLNPDLRRVWPFGGIFCLTFFREGCSPAAPLDEPPLLVVT